MNVRIILFPQRERGQMKVLRSDKNVKVSDTTDDASSNKVSNKNNGRIAPMVEHHVEAVTVQVRVLLRPHKNHKSCVFM